MTLFEQVSTSRIRQSPGEERAPNCGDGPIPSPDRLRDGQNRALRMLARGEPLAAVLKTLVEGAQTAVPGMIGSVLLVENGRLRHGAAPGLPDWYCDAIDGTEIGEAVGSCGTAAHGRRRVIVTDIQSDPLWTDFRGAAARAGLRSCWSEPIFGGDGGCLGTFAMYYATVKAPSALDLELIDDAAQVAGIAIERHKAEVKLREAMQQAQAASRAKSAFLAHMSHELRTPLNAIIGFADMLGAEIYGCLGSDRNREYANDIVGSARHLLDVVTGLLELSRLEGGTATPATPTRVASVVELLAENFSGRAKQKSVAFSTSVTDPGDPIEVDACALGQILTNLLDNALKYTPKGGRIALESHLTAGPRGPSGLLTVRISDTGTGIAPERLPRLREAFEGRGGLTTAEASGLGVGLAVADRLAKLLGGAIDIANAPGGGTVVTLELPVTCVPGTCAEGGVPNG